MQCVCVYEREECDNSFLASLQFRVQRESICSIRKACHPTKRGTLDKLVLCPCICLKSLLFNQAIHDPKEFLPITFGKVYFIIIKENAGNGLFIQFHHFRFSEIDFCTEAATVQWIISEINAIEVQDSQIP